MSWPRRTIASDHEDIALATNDVVSQGLWHYVLNLHERAMVTVEDFRCTMPSQGVA